MSLFWDKQFKHNQQSCPVYAVKGGLCPAALSASGTFIILSAVVAVVPCFSLALAFVKFSPLMRTEVHISVRRSYIRAWAVSSRFCNSSSVRFVVTINSFLLRYILSIAQQYFRWYAASRKEQSSCRFHHRYERVCF